MGSSRSTNTSWTNHILSYFQLYASNFFLLPNCVIWIHLSSGEKQCKKVIPISFLPLLRKRLFIHSLLPHHFFKQLTVLFLLRRLVVGSFPTELWFPLGPGVKPKP